MTPPRILETAERILAQLIKFGATTGMNLVECARLSREAAAELHGAALVTLTAPKP